MAATRRLDVLILDESEDEARLLVRELERQGFEVKWDCVCAAAAMQSKLDSDTWGVILADYEMLGFNALAALQVLHESGRDIPFVVVAGVAGDQHAVEVMKAGAHDYLKKDQLARLGVTIERELRETGMRGDRRRALERVEDLNSVLRSVRDLGRVIVKAKDATALLTGICESLVETRGFANACVAYADEEQKLRVVVFRPTGAGSEAQADRLRAQGLTACMAAAASSDAPVVVEDHSPLVGDCVLYPQHANRQCVVTRLLHDGRSYGSLVLALQDGMAPNEAELELIGGVAGDIAFALHAIEADEQRLHDLRSRTLVSQILQDVVLRIRDVKRLVSKVGSMIRQYGRFEALAIVGTDGGGPTDIVESQGFPESFLAEPSGSVHGRSAESERADISEPALDCLCAKVIAGRVDRSLACVTEGGSFWKNNATETPGWRDVELGACARCNREGYESFALVPLRSEDRIEGILQIADQRADRFSADMIETLEHVGAIAGVALSRARRFQELADSEQRYRELFECSRDALLIAASPSWRFVQGNAAAVRLLGVQDEADLLSRALWEFSPPAQSDGRPSEEVAREKFEAALREGAQLFEFTHRTRSGEDFPATVLLTRIELDGQEQVLATVRDETETRALRATVAQSDRLTSMGMLAAGVAHEINNPLCYVLYNVESLVEDAPSVAAAVRGCAKIAEAELGSKRFEKLMGPQFTALNRAMAEDALECLQDVLEGLGRIREIVRALGTFSRVDQGRSDRVRVEDVIEIAVNIAFNEIKYRATLVKDYGKVAPVRANAGELSQVFLNLLINASHAVGEGDVKKNEIRVRTWQEGDEVFAEVRDTGKGISERTLSRIFEPFFTTKGLGQGTGLGLSISKNSVERLGGRIEVTSRTGEGATFVVRLPADRADDHDEAAKTERAPASAERGGRVLVIDDEAMIRETYARILRGHDVVGAASGDEARTILDADPSFDVILCDMMMPVVSGATLHEWLSRSHPALAKKVVFVTGGAFTRTARKYLESVDNLQLEKPVAGDALKKMVADLVAAARRDHEPASR